MATDKVPRPRENNHTIEIILRLPYITVDPTRRVPCFGWKFSNGKSKPCDSLATYHYKAGKTKKAHARSDWHCWYHLFTNGINFRVYDIQRAQRAYDKWHREKNN